MIKNTNKIQDFDYVSKEEEIDFNILVRFFLRNKIIIASATLLSFVLACVNALNTKRTWEGQFEIVLSGKNSSTSGTLSRIPIEANILRSIGISDKSSNLKTEVGILESPLVLMPIYNFINSENVKLNPLFKKLEFAKWKEKYLTVKLKKGTSILSISYKDKNKKIILPVLKKISSAYQIYSGKSKRRGIDLAKDYLNKQIIEFKTKTSESIKIAQEFAMDQDLSMLDLQSDNSKLLKSNPLTNNLNQTIIGSGFASSTGIEEIRVKAANEIKSLKAKIKKIKELDNQDDQIQYISISIPNIFNDGSSNSLDSLDSLDERLTELKTKYLETDPLILSLELKRKALIELLKDKSIGLLKAQIVMEEAIMESATRPKGVVLKYKELMRKARRNESILVNLENSLSSLKLDEAKSEDPWELIPKPTLSNYPVAPNRKKIGIIGIFIGFVLGIIIAYIKEKKSGLIYEGSTIEKYLDLEIIDTINLDELNVSNSNQSIISTILKANSEEVIKFISINNLKKSNFEKLKIFLSSLHKKISFSNEIVFGNEDGIIILVASLEKLTLSKLNFFKKSMLLLNSKIYGIILVNQK